MAKMMEMLRTLVRDKAQATGQQSGAAQPEQKREDPAYPPRFALPYAQTQPIPQMRGFLYGYAPRPTQTHEVRQNFGANTANPITISDLDDPKEQEKIKKESLE